jgi:hypothetical protein
MPSIKKYLGVSEEWLRSHGRAEAKEAKAVEQMARCLVAVRFANLHETFTDEEQRA